MAPAVEAAALTGNNTSLASSGDAQPAKVVLNYNDFITLLALHEAFKQDTSSRIKRKLLRQSKAILDKITAKQFAWWEAVALKADLTRKLGDVRMQLFDKVNSFIDTSIKDSEKQKLALKARCFDLQNEVVPNGESVQGRLIRNRIIEDCKARIAVLEGAVAELRVCKQELNAEDPHTFDETVRKVRAVREMVRGD